MLFGQKKASFCTRAKRGLQNAACNVMSAAPWTWLQTTLNNLENVRKTLKGDAKDGNAVKGEAATPTKKRKIR